MSIYEERNAHYSEISKHFKYDERGDITNIEQFEFQNKSVYEWESIKHPSINSVFSRIVMDGFVCRVKPQPTWRAFKDKNEFRPYREKWVKRKGDGIEMRINSYDDSAVTFKPHRALLDDVVAFKPHRVWLNSVNERVSYDVLFHDYEFINIDSITEPCGVKE